MSAATAQHLRELDSGARWYKAQAVNLQQQLDDHRASMGLHPEPWQQAMLLRLEADLATHTELAAEYAGRLADAAPAEHAAQEGLF